MPAAHLALDRGDRRRRAVAGHRPRVAEAEVHVVVPVDASEGAPEADSTKGGKGPAHLTIQCIGTPSSSELEGAGVELGGAWVFVREAAALVGHEGREAAAIDGSGGRHPSRMAPFMCGVGRIPGDATTRSGPSSVGGRSRRPGTGATPVVGSTSRKLVQPLVRQYRRVADDGPRRGGECGASP